MTSEKIKRMLDACYQAKRIRDLLRLCRRESCRLTSSIWRRSRHWKNRAFGVKVSDISAAMSLPRPGVTRTVKEMEKKAI